MCNWEIKSKGVKETGDLKSEGRHRQKVVRRCEDYWQTMRGLCL